MAKNESKQMKKIYKSLSKMGVGRIVSRGSIPLLIGVATAYIFRKQIMKLVPVVSEFATDAYSKLSKGAEDYSPKKEGVARIRNA